MDAEYLELIIDFHKDASRQGPGSEEDTLKALSLIDLLSQKNIQVADIGSGSGGQTMTLARLIQGHITAVDLFPEFLEKLTKQARIEGLNEKVTTLAASMDQLPFKKETFDIIWSEGAIYNIGFEQGVKYWFEFLKPGGHLAVSEVTWISNKRPKELENFWNNAYPEIGMASSKIDILETNGYTLTGYFILGEDSWIKNYYQPMELRYDSFLERHNNSEVAMQIVQEYRDESAMYNRFKDYFSYGFYVACKK